MKYIDAEKLIAEIESLYDNMLKRIKIGEGNSDYWAGKADAYRNVIDTITSLQQEQPDFPPINPDDAMKELDEKIALVKKNGSWDGVDVDKFMDDVRGREPEKSTELDELMKEAQRYYSDNFDYISSDQPTLSILTNIARHFAEWGYLRAAEKYNEIEYNRQRAEDSVPDDLEEAAMNYIAPIENEDGLKVINFSGQDIKDAFIAGAEWQYQKDRRKFAQIKAKTWSEGFDACKEQMMKDGNVILAEEDFDAEKEKSMERGYNLCKEQMMKGAIHYVVQDDLDPHGVSYNIPFIRIGTIALKPKGIGVGDKVRIIIIKEEKNGQSD